MKCCILINKIITINLLSKIALFKENIYYLNI